MSNINSNYSTFLFHAAACLSYKNSSIKIILGIMALLLLINAENNEFEEALNILNSIKPTNGIINVLNKDNSISLVSRIWM